MTIPFRPIAYQDESAASLIIRATELNGHVKTSHLLMVCARNRGKRGTTITSFSHPATLLPVLRFLELDDSNVGLLIPRTGRQNHRIFEGVRLSHAAFVPDAAQFCPECLESSKYWRRKWLLKAYAVCIDHARALIKGCPSCGRELSSSRGVLHECGRCGYDLTSATQSPRVERIAAWLGSSMKIGTIDFFLTTFFKFDALFNFSRPACETLKLIYLFVKDPLYAEEKIAKSLAMGVGGVHPKILLLPMLRDSRFTRFANGILARLQKLVGFPLYSPPIGCLNYSDTMTLLNISHKLLKKLIDKEIISSVSKPVPCLTFVSIWPLINLSIDEIRLCYDKQVNHVIKLKTLISMSDAARRLKSDKALVGYLIKLGYFEAKQIFCDGDSFGSINLGSLESFMADFAFGSVFAEELGVPARSLLAKLAALDIHPVFSSSLNGATRNIYRRTHLVGITKDRIAATKVTSKRRDPKNPLNIASAVLLHEAAEILNIKSFMVVNLVKDGLLIKNSEFGKPFTILRESLDSLLSQVQRDDFRPLQSIISDMDLSSVQFRSYFVLTSFVSLIDFRYWELITTADASKVKDLLMTYMTIEDARKHLLVTNAAFNLLAAEFHFSFVRLGCGGTTRRLFLRKDIESYALAYSGALICVGLH